MSLLDSPSEATERQSPARLASVGHLVDETIGFVRMIHALKAHHTSSNRSAHSLLFPLTGAGPMRLTALAESVHADPSTVSRQVAELVREDLVQREADPADGRACLLVVTDRGHEACAGMRAARNVSVAEALSDWTQEEISSFTCALQRFSAGLAGSLGWPANPSDHGVAAAPPSIRPSAQEH